MAEAAPAPQRQRRPPALPPEALRLICQHATYPTLVSMQQAGGQLGEEAKRRRDELEASYWSYLEQASGGRHPLGEPFYRDLSPAGRAALDSAEARVAELVLDDEAFAVDLPALESKLRKWMYMRCEQLGLGTQLTPGRSAARVISVTKPIPWHRPWEPAQPPPRRTRSRLDALPRDVLRLICQHATYPTLVSMQQVGGELGEEAQRRRDELEKPYWTYFTRGHGVRHGGRYPLGRKFRDRLRPAARAQLDSTEVRLIQLLLDDQETSVALPHLDSKVRDWVHTRCRQLGLQASYPSGQLTVAKRTPWRRPWERAEDDPPSYSDDDFRDDSDREPTPDDFREYMANGFLEGRCFVCRRKVEDLRCYRCPSCYMDFSHYW